MSSEPKTEPVAADAETLELLKGVLVLQAKAFEELSAAHHRQREAFIQQIGRDPLTYEPATAAHKDPIALRVDSDAPSAAAAALSVPEVLARLIREHCDADGRLLSAAHVRAFVKAAKAQLQTIEEQMQAIYVFDMTLQASHDALEKGDRSELAGLAKTFESDQGFDLIVDWFAGACTYRDEARVAFSTIALQLIQRNRPIVPFTRKHIRKRLRPLMAPKYLSRLVRGKLNTVMNDLRESTP